MTYKISSRAQLDLIEIWEYTVKNWSVNQADKYYRILNDQIKNISKDPNLGRSYEATRKDYRGVIVKSHIIFYKIDVSDEIEIIRILHKRMDLENQLQKAF